MMGKTDTRSTSVEKPKLEATEQLINKVCEKFSERLENKFSKTFDLLNEKLADVIQTLKTLDQSMKTNKSDIQFVAKKCDDMDQYMKRNSLRFNGIAEDEEEKLLDVIVNLVNDKLKVTCSVRDINCVLRLGKPTPSKPRSVIVNFVTYIKRNEVYYSRKLLKGSGIFVFEDLTKFRYSLLTSAKAKYGKQDVIQLQFRYNLFRSDRVGRGGGVAIYIKNNIGNCEVLTFDFLPNDNLLEHLWIKFKCHDNSYWYFYETNCYTRQIFEGKSLNH
ncbi:hypothetical protein NQ318_014716 [Aromia moschata]|uniref:Uncharacterized protein n=1 Tax=Aromia moschata TaxID=1265417 RepID=A0AAV8ZB48_9CUCU|nr:hypothetical protein NQ318_014716 [Aromia moschata]